MSGKRPPKWARRFRRLLLLGAGGVLVLFLALQILLATPWMRGRVGAGLTARTGLEVSMTGLGWTPWSGASVEGLVVEQPAGVRELTEEPLLRVHSMRIFPDYGACLRKQWRAHRIEVDRPELVLSIEMLASIVAASLPPTQPPAIAVVEDLKPPPTVPLPAPSGTGEGEPTIPAPAGPKDPKPRTEVEVPKEVVARALRPLEIEVHEASLRCLSVSHSMDLFRVEGVSCDLPIGSDKREGECQIQEIFVLGESIEANVRLVVSSEADVVYFRILNDLEKKKQLTGNVVVKVIQGLPVQALVQYEAKESLFWQLPGLGVAEVTSNQTLVQGAGWLLAPRTWQGLCRFQGAGIALKNQGLRFDRYGGNLLLDRGVLRVPDIRVLGDQFGLLGNGWMTPHDGAGVLRLVVPEGATGMVQQRLRSGPLEPLGPGNRRFLDIEFWRDADGWVTDLEGNTRPLAELWTAEERAEKLEGPGVSEGGR